MKALVLVAVLFVCLPMAWIIAGVIVPVVLGVLGIALLPLILLGKLFFPILIIWLVWKLLIEEPRRV